MDKRRTLVEVAKLNKTFGSFQVLKDIDLSLRQGDVVALIGPNGCGKTTLIKCLLGMVIPARGKISIQGQPVRKEWQYRQDIGYMPQISRYPDNMRVSQILNMIKDLRRGNLNGLDEELYEPFQLSQIQHKTMSTLSGGTRQKVSAYLAFLFNPTILMLDEPTAGLDPLASEILKTKIQKARDQGKLILITSHILSELEDTVNRVVYMQEGMIYFDKTLPQLMEDTGKSRFTDAIAHVMREELSR